MKNISLVIADSILDAVALFAFTWNYTGRFIVALIFSAFIFIIKINVFENTGAIKKNVGAFLTYIVIALLLIIGVGSINDVNEINKILFQIYFFLKIIMLISIKFGSKK